MLHSGTASNHSVQNVFNFTTPVQEEWDFTKPKSSLWSREVTNIFKILVGKPHVKRPQGPSRTWNDNNKLDLTEKRPRTNGWNTPTSYSGGPGFKSPRVDRYLDWGSSWFFPVSPSKFGDNSLKLSHGRFLPHPFQFIIHLSSIRRNIVFVTEKASPNKMQITNYQRLAPINTPLHSTTVR
jgi:hypothetical protein